MCTLSVLRSAGAPGAADPIGPRWRVVCNRDEQRTRLDALPPAVGTIGHVRTISPIDPEGPGTWIAATSAGLVFGILNGPSARAPGPFVSRGRIIPLIAGASDPDDAVARLTRLRPLATRPFTLLVAGDDGVLQVEWDGCTLVSQGVTADPLVMRTSSSVDADAVRSARTRVFRTHVAEGQWHTQDAFHRWVDSARPARGVLMSRPDACTVSITTIEMSGSHLRLAYRPVNDGSLRADVGSTAVLEVDRAR